MPYISYLASKLSPMGVNFRNSLFLATVLLLAAAMLPANAQKITFSTPQKTTKITDYELLGLTKAGILVRKWGDRLSLVEAFDPNNLSQKWTKELPIDPKKSKIIKAVAYEKPFDVAFHHSG